MGSEGQPDGVRAGLMALARAALAEALAPHTRETEALRGAVTALRAEVAALSAERARCAARLERAWGPFVLEMTVHEAWARHPGVRRVFTRHHLPACDACAVGVDETLGEAADGHDLDPIDLLAELNALLGG